MSFFERWFRKRKQDPFEVEFFKKDIPLSTIARWYIYDTELAEPNEIAELMGLSNVSEEGNEKERQDSDARLQRIDYLLPFLDAIANIGAESITSIQVAEIITKNPDDKEEIEREVGTMRILYKVIGMAAVIGAFSSAMEIGLIKEGELAAADWIDPGELGEDDE